MLHDEAVAAVVQHFLCFMAMWSSCVGRVPLLAFLWLASRIGRIHGVGAMIVP